MKNSILKFLVVFFFTGHAFAQKNSDLKVDLLPKNLITDISEQIEIIESYISKLTRSAEENIQKNEAIEDSGADYLNCINNEDYNKFCERLTSYSDISIREHNTIYKATIVAMQEVLKNKISETSKKISTTAELDTYNNVIQFYNNTVKNYMSFAELRRTQIVRGYILYKNLGNGSRKKATSYFSLLLGDLRSHKSAGDSTLNDLKEIKLQLN